MRNRGTALVFQGDKVLLVRDKGKTRYSLPGGGTGLNETSEQAAKKELYEELGLTAIKTERLPECDTQGKHNFHTVTLIETTGNPRLNDEELREFIWWDQITNIPRYNYVDRIFKKNTEADKGGKNDH